MPATSPNTADAAIITIMYNGTDCLSFRFFLIKTDIIISPAITMILITTLTTAGIGGLISIEKKTIAARYTISSYLRIRRPITRFSAQRGSMLI